MPRKKTRGTRAEYRDAAKKRYHDEGTIEVDDNAKVHFSEDGGAYVQAYVWVSNALVGIEDEA